METITVTPQTLAKLTKVAQARASSVEILAEQVIRDFLQAEAEQKMAQEVEAFRILHPQLLTKYPHQFVAIHHGALIDHDTDQLALYLRLEEAYPDETVFIRQVLPEIEQTYTIHSTRFVRDEQNLQL